MSCSFEHDDAGSSTPLVVRALMKFRVRKFLEVDLVYARSNTYNARSSTSEQCICLWIKTLFHGVLCCYELMFYLI